MEQLLTVQTPAADLNLLTTDELRAVAGVTDSSKDTVLTRLGTRVADLITQACRVAADGVKPPTLRKETLVETIRQEPHYCGRRRNRKLLLSRRPIISVASIVEDGATLAAGSDFEVNKAEASVLRLCDDQASCWGGCKIVVTYDAGFETVPEGLKMAAETLLRGFLFSESRDPALRQINIPGVVERQYWVGSSKDPQIPDSVMEMLDPYRNPVFG